jgi:hypothetical protein
VAKLDGSKSSYGFHLTVWIPSRISSWFSWRIFSQLSYRHSSSSRIWKLFCFFALQGARATEREPPGDPPDGSKYVSWQGEAKICAAVILRHVQEGKADSAEIMWPWQHTQ